MAFLSIYIIRIIRIIRIIHLLHIPIFIRAIWQQ
jgi:hypothetical protein